MDVAARKPYLPSQHLLTFLVQYLPHSRTLIVQAVDMRYSVINPPSNIPLSYIPKAIIEFLSTQGVASSEALRNTAIEPYLLDTTNEKISFAQLSQIFHNCVHSLGSGCGIQAGAYIPWCFYGTLGETVNCSHSLFAVGLAFRRYVILTQPYYFHYYRTCLLYTSDAADE